jgi:hypothetical protein
MPRQAQCNAQCSTGSNTIKIVALELVVEHRIRHTRATAAGLTRHRCLTRWGQTSAFASNVAFECAACFEAVL